MAKKVKIETFHPAFPIESVDNSREFIENLYSDPEIQSLVDPSQTNDLMGAVLDFYDWLQLDSDNISEVELIGGLTVEDDGVIRDSKIMISFDDSDPKYIHFVGHVANEGNYKFLGFSEISYFHK